jgi:hypothetical protein
LKNDDDIIKNNELNEEKVKEVKKEISYEWCFFFLFLLII